MRKILIAARSETFCAALADKAVRRFETEICHDGDQTLQLAFSGKPDLLVLDMELPGRDGINILGTLRAGGSHIPVVVLTSCPQSTYLSQMAARFHVACVIAKPCTAAAVLRNLCEIFACLDNEEKTVDLNHMVDLMLQDLNFNQQMCGYICLIEAIKLYNADPSQQITKTLYPGVAKICGGSSKRVEHAMRTCISDAWKRRNDDIWKLYFLPGRKKCAPPANGKFISKMSKCLENMKTG